MPSNTTKPCFLQANFEEFHKSLIRSDNNDQSNGKADQTLTAEFTASQPSMTETTTHSNNSRSAQMNALSYQSVHNPGSLNVARVCQSRAGNPQHMASLQLPPACFNLVNRKRDRPQPRKAIPLSLFKSITSTESKPKKRTYSEINQTQSAFRPVSSQVSENTNAKRQRFLRTAEALEKSGLMKVTMKSASLLQQNKHLQNEIEELKKETQKFIQWVMSNPENQHLRTTC